MLLVDPRAGYLVQHSLSGHSAGLADMDVRGDMLATCGYGTRQGQVVPDTLVKVRSCCSMYHTHTAHCVIHLARIILN